MHTLLGLCLIFFWLELERIIKGHMNSQFMLHSSHLRILTAEMKRSPLYLNKYIDDRLILVIYHKTTPLMKITAVMQSSLLVGKSSLYDIFKNCIPQCHSQPCKGSKVISILLHVNPLVANGF